MKNPNSLGKRNNLKLVAPAVLAAIALAGCSDKSEISPMPISRAELSKTGFEQKSKEAKASVVGIAKVLDAKNTGYDSSAGANVDAFTSYSSTGFSVEFLTATKDKKSKDTMITQDRSFTVDTQPTSAGMKIVVHDTVERGCSDTNTGQSFFESDKRCKVSNTSNTITFVNPKRSGANIIDDMAEFNYIVKDPATVLTNAASDNTEIAAFSFVEPSIVTQVSSKHSEFSAVTLDKAVNWQ